jgi:hypothetical protein
MLRLLSKKRRREKVYLVIILSEYEEASRRFGFGTGLNSEKPAGRYRGKHMDFKLTIFSDYI